jgi:polysaccharide biosynthesis protein PslH
MKILMLTPYLPYPLHSGGQIRTYNLLKKLSKKHDITLFALIKDRKEEENLRHLSPFCKKIKLFKRSNRPFTLQNILKTGFSSFPFLVIRNHVTHVTEAIQEELAREQYDVIHAETFYMMPHIPETHVPTLLVEQTIEYLGYESYAKKAPAFIRPLLQIDINKLKRWEKHYWNHCDQLVVMSQEDKAFVKEHVYHNIPISVVENGVDSEWFSSVDRSEPEEPTVLFVGTFRWLPNLEAVRILVNQIWPLVLKTLPKARLAIVGAAPTSEVQSFADKNPSISVSGNIPDIRTAFASSHVLAAPVWSGKGTRYKVLEALAAGTPVVATTTAVEGLAITPAKEAMVADNPEEFAKAIVSLLRNDAKRDQLRLAGRSFVKHQFDWQLIAGKLDAIYRRIGDLSHVKKNN